MRLHFIGTKRRRNPLRRPSSPLTTSHAEAHGLRFSAIYAALDTSSVVGLPPFQATLEQRMLINAGCCHGELTGGRSFTLWVAIEEQDPK